MGKGLCGKESMDSWGPGDLFLEGVVLHFSGYLHFQQGFNNSVVI